MRILVTGAAGFIGHRVARHLEEAGHEVVGLVRCGRIGSFRRLEEVGFEGRLVWHDLRSPIPEPTVRELGYFDVVLHFGAETHVDRSITDPADFVMSNVMGTTHLLMWARGHTKRYIQFSTDEVFGPIGTVGDAGMYAFAENAEHNPRNPYAASKSAAEQVVKSFANTYQLNTCIVRGMNVFGERQHSEKWVPTIIRKIFKGEVIQIHSDSTRTRAGSRFYIYVGNVARAIEFIIENGCQGPYHIVGEREVNNLEMVQAIWKAMKTTQQVTWQLVDFHSSRPGHDLRYAMQDNNLRSIGWKIPQSFEESLQATVDWYVDHREWL